MKLLQSVLFTGIFFAFLASGVSAAPFTTWKIKDGKAVSTKLLPKGSTIKIRVIKSTKTKRSLALRGAVKKSFASDDVVKGSVLSASASSPKIATISFSTALYIPFAGMTWESRKVTKIESHKDKDHHTIHFGKHLAIDVKVIATEF